MEDPPGIIGLGPISSGYLTLNPFTLSPPVNLGGVNSKLDVIEFEYETLRISP